MKFYNVNLFKKVNNKDKLIFYIVILNYINKSIAFVFLEIQKVNIMPMGNNNRVTKRS